MANGVRFANVRCIPGTPEYSIALFVKALECPACKDPESGASHTKICDLVDAKCCYDCR